MTDAGRVHEPDQPVEDDTASAGPLSEPVRLRVIMLAADALGDLPAEQVPAPLRRIAKFTPSRRARLASAPLAAVLEADPVFRQRIAEQVRLSIPAVADVVAEGGIAPAAPPADVAALAYLLRPAGWRQVLDDATAAAEREAEHAAAVQEHLTARQADEDVRAARDAAHAQIERLRAEVAKLRQDNDELRHRLGLARERARQAEAAARRAETDLGERAGAAEAALSAAEAEARRLRARQAELETALSAARRAAREGRSLDDARVWLLLDTVVSAAQGLRREIAVPPPVTRPGDVVAGELAAEEHVPFAGVGARGLDVDDPAVFDQLLALPGVHLIVDGYNVTKLGYGDLPLQAQRSRLLGGLAALAAQSGCEVTCVFDGAVREGPVTAPPPRRVRQLFSAPGQTADEVIRRLAAAEPAGRPVVVVSSDREVAEGVRRNGARSVASSALLRRLSRG